MPAKHHWNWQKADWPDFQYDREKLAPLEFEFMRRSGIFMGAMMHVTEDDKRNLIVELIADEALETSEIEGEILSRDSLQSSIRRQFGLATDHRRIPPAEAGIAEMMVQLYRKFDGPVTDELLFAWHRLVMNGRSDLPDIGRYRTGHHSMQVVSGPIHEPEVHFEAPPAERMANEMAHFLEWFRSTGPTGNHSLPPLARAGIAHLYFVSIHPFEDGNGRIGRALAEKAISEALGQPTLIALSHTINARRSAYYHALERVNTTLEVTDWLLYFARIILDAQDYAQRLLEFVIAKAKFHDRFRGQFNERQEKAIARMKREGPAGFQGGLSAEKYIRITGASRATATRDLQDLFYKDAVVRTGTLKSTRYTLNLPDQN
jgi:Fic family protein